MHPAGKTWPGMEPSSLITGFRAAELQSDDPLRLAERWAEVLDRPLTVDAHAHPCIELHDAVLRFVKACDGRGEGLGGIDLGCRDVPAVLGRAAKAGLRVEDETVMVCGTRVKLIQGA